MVASYEYGLTEKERAKLVEWLKGTMGTRNSFLGGVADESEQRAFCDFFAELARRVRIGKIAFAKDFVTAYNEATENFNSPNGEYDNATKGIMYQCLFSVISSLLKDEIISKNFAEEVKECDAAERIAVFARNN